ncbi:MAG: SLC13 family permease [Desulfobacterales bacterium]
MYSLSSNRDLNPIQDDIGSADKDDSDMSFEAYVVIGILAAAVVMFSFEWLSPDVVAVLVLFSLVWTDILTPQEAFSGFGSSAVIAIGAILVLGAGLVRSGAVRWVAERLGVLAGSSYRRLLLVSTVVPGLLSGFINIVAAVSIFIPAVLRLARRSRFKSSGFLLPMAVSGLVGANLSLIGASHNLVVNSLLQEKTNESFGFFEFTPIGIVLLAGIVLYAVFLSEILLRTENKTASENAFGPVSDLVATYRLNDRLWEVLVTPDSSACCRTLGDIGPGKHYGLGVLMILRGHDQLPVENKDVPIQGNDVLALSGSRERVEAFIHDHNGMVLMGQPQAEKDFTWSAFDLVEVVIPPRSRLIGMTLREAGLRSNWGLTGIALWRDNRPYRTDIRDRKLQPGDGLLLFGSRYDVEHFKPKPDFLWLQKPRKQEAPLHLRKYAPVAAVIFLAVIISAAFNVLSIAVAALGGAALMIITGILTPKLAYRKIEWRTLILIAGMYPIGTALQKTGAADRLADIIIATAGTWGVVPALVAVGFLALILTQPMHNAVAALIVTPIALQIAESLNANPKAFALAVIVGASASFIMPVGHPAPLLVKGPGKYRNSDYLKFGIGAALFVLAVIAVAIPAIWPIKG